MCLFTVLSHGNMFISCISTLFKGGEQTDCVDVTSDPILQPIRLSTSSFDDTASECDMSSTASVADQSAPNDSKTVGSELFLSGQDGTLK